MKTQKEIIMDHIRAHGSITVMEAFEKGITNLPGRIYDLKHDGEDIQSTTETGKTRYGKKCSYSRYFLGEQR